MTSRVSASQKRHRDALLRTKRVMFLCEEKQAATSIVDIPEKVTVPLLLPPLCIVLITFIRALS